jgi:hypothetical protein
MAKAKNHYVNNKQMHAKLLEWKNAVRVAEAAGAQRPRVPEYIGECIKLIATNLARKPNFMNYSFKEEMIGDGIENCLMYIDNFNPEKYKNPFAYFTQIIYYAFLRRIQKEKKQTYIKHKVMNHDMVFNNLVENGEGSDGQFDAVKLTYDPEKMAALEELFEKKKPSATKKKVGLDALLDLEEEKVPE